MLALAMAPRAPGTAQAAVEPLGPGPARSSPWQGRQLLVAEPRGGGL